MEAFAPSVPDAVFVADHRRSILGAGIEELRRLVRYRHLVKFLLSAALRFEHVGTIFGYLWWLLDPLLTGAVYVVLFDVMLGTGGKNFAVFVFTSVLVWKSVTVSVRSAMSQTFGRQTLMKQIAFPRTVIPLVAVGAETVRFLLGLVALVGFAAAFGLYPDASFAYLPLVLLLQLPLVLGIALLLSALGVLYRDVDNLSDFLLRCWFFLSPGVYAISVVPGGIARSFYDVNPFAVILPAYHAIFVHSAMPHLAALAYVASEALVALLLGYLVFVRLQPMFAKVR